MSETSEASGPDPELYLQRGAEALAAIERVAREARTVVGLPEEEAAAANPLLRSLAEELDERVGELAEQSAKLSALLGRAGRAFSASAATPAESEGRSVEVRPEDGPEKGSAPASRLDPAADHVEPAESAPAADRQEGVRLLATQMMVAGRGRAEVERELRDTYGVRDADRIVDEVFGDR